MEKTFCTDDHPEVLAAAEGHAFTYFDRSDRMTKSASDVISRKDIQEHMPPDTHFGVHLVTMGDEETFGPNRNADSASQRALQKYHHTFEKFAHVYREHANRDPKTQGVGVVKLARVNDAMHRGELIVWVDKDKAPDMYKKAKEGKEQSWSMSMRLPHDECSCCKKKSRTTAEYCDDLKHHLLTFRPGFKKFAYARNEENIKFFDISEVKRRADRIATYLGYFGDSLHKAASDGSPLISGAQWAEHLNGKRSVTPFTPWEELTLEKMASFVRLAKDLDNSTWDTFARMSPATLSDQDVINTLAAPDFRSVGGELTKRAMLLNFPTFAAIITGRPVVELQKDACLCEAMNAKLPTLLEELLRNGGSQCGEEAAAAVTPDECGCSFAPQKDAIDQLIRSVGDNLGMTDPAVRGRTLNITIIKRAALRDGKKVVRSLDPYYSAMVEAYGHYLVKAAHQILKCPNVSEKMLLNSIAASLLFCEL